MSHTFTGFMNNPRLKPSGVKSSLTAEQVSEYTKCFNDPIYFIENYLKIVHLDKGIVPFILRPYQKRMIESVHYNRFTICKCPRQAGKCLSIYTVVKVRHKSTGVVEEVTLGELHRRFKEKYGNPNEITKEG